MSITPEQFNKLATKDDHNQLENKVDKLDAKFSTMMDTLDGIAKDVKDVKSDKAVNQSAHDRIQSDVNEVCEHVGLDIKHPTFEPEGV